jgi:formate hydrogenlyase subunit 6/NADH:ubiquinone oxidoreductase subunit I
MKPYPTFDRSICIKCYCCHEHCPEGAIYLTRENAQ